MDIGWTELIAWTVLMFIPIIGALWYLLRD